MSVAEAIKTPRRARRRDDAAQAWNFVWLILPLAVLYGIFALLPPRHDPSVQYCQRT